jgi:predicted nuclease with TOPRIM domain
VRRILVALGAAAVLAAAGCGGSGGGESLSKEEFQAAVVDVGMVLEAAFDEIAEETTAVGEDIGSLDEAGAAFEALAVSIEEGSAALEQAADDLDELEPPDEAKDANDELASGLRALAADLDELAAALEGGDFTQILELGRELQEIATSDAGKQIEGAIEELKSLGFDVEGDETEG